MLLSIFPCSLTNLINFDKIATWKCVLENRKWSDSEKSQREDDPSSTTTGNGRMFSIFIISNFFFMIIRFFHILNKYFLFLKSLIWFSSNINMMTLMSTACLVYFKTIWCDKLINFNAYALTNSNIQCHINCTIIIIGDFVHLHLCYFIYYYIIERGRKNLLHV